MRLLKLDSHGDVSLTDYLQDNIPPYGILSHTWGSDNNEVTFDDLRNGVGKTKPGYAKIQFCGQQSKKDRLEYFWVDTCCINKSSDAELSEAINSMFRWYSKAQKCYVYLSDVSSRKRDSQGETQPLGESSFRDSRWFTRGWTLQELLAPASVEFFSREGELLGSKETLEGSIQEITGIPVSALRGAPLTDFSVSERMKWAAQRKTKRVEDKYYCLLGIFDVFMPPIYGEREHASVRLKNKIGQRYRNQLDEIEHSLGSTDSTSVPSNVSPQDLRKELLNSLRFEQMDSRRSTIKSAYSTTCKWLLKHDAYVDWLDPNLLQQHGGFLWINGKPGAGKSTLLKFAHAHAEAHKKKEELVISFFFNARGDELEKSTIGMYRALLFQLFTKATDLQELLNDFIPSFEDQNQRQAWTIESLRRLLSLAIARLGQRQVKCFIDALDECEEQQVQEMVIFFEELGQTAIKYSNQLFVCFASRHYPTIDTRNGKQLTLEHEHGHSEDLAKYVHNHLRAGKGSYVEEVKSRVQEKANGVFIWAVLVIEILNEEFRRGRIFAVKKRLQEIPPKLGDLFKDILRRDCTNMTDLLLCLQWILFAKRPLRREEFYFAMVAGLDPEPQNMNEWDPESVTESDMNRFVLNSSKGLAELTKSRTPTVQFIHESVRDYLIKDDGLHELWPELEGDLYSLSHDQLKNCCWSYLHVDLSNHVPPETDIPKPPSKSAKDLRRHLNLKFPFLDYAGRHVLYHANEAARNIPQEDFLANFPLQTLLSVTNLFEQYEVRRHSQDTHLLYVLAENNLARLIAMIRHRYSTVHIPGERYRYPLFAAFANGHRDAIRALLQQVEYPITEDLLARLNIGRAFSPRKDITPLLWALEERNEALAEILAASKDQRPDFKFDEGLLALRLAAGRGFERVVNLLVEQRGVDVNLPGKLGVTPLIAATQHGQTAMVQLLFDRGAHVDATSSLSPPPLCHAANNGHNLIVQLLISLGVDIEAKATDGRSALIAAAKMGRKETVQLLLELGANIEATTKDGFTALILAAGNNHAAVVLQLLQRGANIEAKNGWGMTALLVAAERGHKATLHLLLEQGANTEAADKLGNTAIIRATLSGYKEKVRRLSRHYTYIKRESGYVRNTLSFASEEEDTQTSQNLSPFGGFGALAEYQMQLSLLEDLNTNRLISIDPGIGPCENALSIVNLLLANGANPNASGIDGITALIIAAKVGFIEVVPDLLHANANLEAVDNSGMTALHWSAKQKWKNFSRLLVANGANKTAQDKYGRTPLSYAQENADKETIQLLLTEEADLDTINFIWVPE